MILALLVSLAAQDLFETRVRPVLATRCYSCHSKQAKTPFAGLQVDSREGLLRGGDRGPAIVPGKANESRLMAAVRHQTVAMPPNGKLKDDEIEALARWIDAGAPWPADRPAASVSTSKAAAPPLWSLQPLRTSFSFQSIDGFINARLGSLAVAPRADRRTLLRRLAYDLTGLPPGPDDGQPVERVVDRLLASPHFGERQARHWLDLARFSDAGFNNVRFGYAYTYRDWVIQAFNSNLPYDQFVTAQLAADQADRRHLAALGFLAIGHDPHRPSGLPEKVDDRIDTVTRTFLGFTVACARCHDHKYDPIPTRDYYSLYGVFANSEEPLEGVASGSAAHPFYDDRLALRRRQLEDYKKERIGELRKDALAIREKYEQAAAEGRSMTNPQLENLAREKNLNSYVLRRWRDGMPDPALVPLEDFGEVQTEGDYNTTNNLRWQYRKMLADDAFRNGARRAMGVTDSAVLKPAHVLVRGNLADPGEPVPRRFLSAICGADCGEFRTGAGRLDLARAIVDKKNPLTARVMVNRVWQHLFGEGLVRTPSDLGRRGEAPTHPELLDWLAAEFMREGWSVKRLIRRIVLSDVYQRSAGARTDADPENRLLAHQNRRRMDFESLRDAMLSAAGSLDPTVGGPSFSLAAVPADPRRTMYAFVERERAQALLKSFNTADPEQHTAQRFDTTVPQQALFMMNSPFVAEQARRIAERASTVEDMYSRVLGRAPTMAERESSERFMKSTGSYAVDGSGNWSYGVGALDPEKGIKEFRPFKYFVNGAWQAASLLPHRVEGNANLTAEGGAPGDDLAHAVIRRWTAPSKMTVTITGTLSQALDQFELRFGFTNGVRGWIVHSRRGVLGRYDLKHEGLDPDPKGGKTNRVDTMLSAVEVEAGDSIDFVVDALDDYENDNFRWAPVVAAAGRQWKANADFAPPMPAALNPREQLAQVLFLTNEFAFIE